jgi:Tol biopolymer transport system component
MWKVPAQGGEAVPVTRNGWSPVEAPDGRFLYYVKGPPIGCNLWRVPVEGGEESQVLESLSAWNAFDVVDEGIYFVPTSKLSARASTEYSNFGGTSIQFLNLATRKVKSIAAIEGGSDGLSVSPDRRWILYTQLVQQGSDLLLVENFK